MRFLLATFLLAYFSSFGQWDTQHETYIGVIYEKSGVASRDNSYHYNPIYFRVQPKYQNTGG